MFTYTVTAICYTGHVYVCLHQCCTNLQYISCQMSDVFVQRFFFSAWCRVGNKNQECGWIAGRVQTRNNDWKLSGLWIWTFISRWLIEVHFHFPDLMRELVYPTISSFDPHFRKSQIIFFVVSQTKTHGSQDIIYDEFLMTEGDEKEGGVQQAQSCVDRVL